MIVTTTHSIEGRPVREYLGIVSGESVAGTNFVKDFFAGITDILGGRSRGYEDSLNKVKDEAIADMMEHAAGLGADAVIGVDLDYEVIASAERNMLLCVANGTAVQL